MTLDLWGKSKPDGRWLSLFDHSADVAATTEALLKTGIMVTRLSAAAGRNTLSAVDISRLAALAALHDFGKANRGFQARRYRSTTDTAGHIAEAAWFFGGQADAPLQERLIGALGFEAMAPWFATAEACNEYLCAILAHHGRPANREMPCIRGRALWKAGPDCDPIAALKPLGDAIPEWFPQAFREGPPLPAEPAFLHAFAGLLMLADWIASDETLFPWPESAAQDRMPAARQFASAALHRLGLTAKPAQISLAARDVTFATIAGGHAARPMQAAASTVEGRLVVLEAETGSGKTEAALFRYLRLFAAGEVDSLYFALPTRVAATQIFERVKRVRDAAFPQDSRPAVVLAVPGQMRVDDAEGHPLPDFAVQWNDGEHHVERWAAEHPKRYLAAPIAVGTIDQVLLSVVSARHAHMRGTALLRSLLVVDEVHASEAYMERLLMTLLASHVAAGGHALLLSATLGAGMKARLFGMPVPPLAEAIALPYPAITAGPGRGAATLSAHPDPSSRSKAVRMETLPALGDPATIAEFAVTAARAGAKVLVIRNTVGTARATMAALAAAAGESSPLLFRVGDTPTLHHSRYAPADRRLLDHAVQNVLGKARENISGHVVIGTQTLEQSLDLDADLLITDLCPVDVLLQRIGRLHRHERTRPRGFEAPRAMVLVPGTRDLLAKSLTAHGLGATSRNPGVYPDLRIIEATWRLIEAHDEWVIPAMNRRLVESATHPQALLGLEAELAARDPRWSTDAARQDGRVHAATLTAGIVTIDRNRPFSGWSYSSDEYVATRLGARDVQVQFARPFRSAFGALVETLAIPNFLLRHPMPDDFTVEVVERGDGVTFSFGESRFTYDRTGLRRAADNDGLSS